MAVDTEVLCARCRREIASARDLMVVAYVGMLLRPYHTPCYGEMEKSVAYHWFTRSFPVNHEPGDVYAVLGLVWSLVVVFLVLSQTSRVGWALLAALPGLWPGALRLWSYLRFERPLVLRELRGP